MNTSSTGFYLGNLSNNSIYAGLDHITSVYGHNFNTDTLPNNRTGNIYNIQLPNQTYNAAYWIRF